ncbi:unnamed protein product [Symbiodinium natans]|uniref:Uncharacterized protein n=1 Tax=Symbiodinium natans TaxID=878477 RepID=A0A812UQW0_9DINO|nr:unnamed protein product [Symbiodinium natans]
MQGDAYYGPGVYANRLPPVTPIYKVLDNNYDMDGGVQHRGTDKMDRADFVVCFEVDLYNDDSIIVINDTAGRSVLTIGGGQNVSLSTAVDHGPAQDVANREEARQKFCAMRAEDGLLDMIWGRLVLNTSRCSLGFWHMDKLNYQEAKKLHDGKLLDLRSSALTPDQFAKNVSWVRQSDQWAPADDGTLRFQGEAGTHNAAELGFVGFDKVMVVVWDGSRSPEFRGFLLHGNIDEVEAIMAKKQAEWSKHFAKLESLAPGGEEVKFLWILLQLLTTKECYYEF